MAQVTITQLPQAGALTGAESVPIVQNGVTVQTTTGAIAGAGALNYPFLTVGQTAGLAQSRYISTNAGLTLTDNGAQGTLQINLTGAALSLNSSGTGIQVKTGSNTVTARQIAVNAGLTISNGDGVSGNPTIGLGTLLNSFAALTGTGILAMQSGIPAKINILGITSQTSITNGDGSGNVTVGLANNPVLPGSAGTVVPGGNTASRPVVATNGTLRYNSDTAVFEGYANNAWGSIATGVGVTSVGTGTGLTGGPITSTGTISIADTTVIAGSYGSVTEVGTFTVNAQGQLTSAGNVTVTPAWGSITGTPTTIAGYGITDGVTLTGSQTLTNKSMSGASNTFTNIPNSALSNYTISGVALGGNLFGLTIGTGLTGGSYNGSGAVTVAIDSTVATLSGTQTLTNKSISGSTNTLTNIPNSALTNSSVTIGSTNVALGGTATTLAGLTSITLTQDPVSDLQVATKQYVDSIASGLNYHQPVNYASTVALPAYTYNNGTGGVGATITANANGALSFGGGSPTAGQRLLVKDEAGANQPYNGIYTVTSTGSPTTKFQLTRATDYDSSGSGTNEIDAGDYVLVLSGTNASTAWVQQTPLPITVGTTALVFLQFNAPITYTAGTGLNLSPATTFNISNTTVTAASYGSASAVATFTVNAQGQLTAAATTSISINGNQITSGTVGSSYISGSYTGITGVGTLTAGTWNATVIDPAYGGTGLSSYAVGNIIYATGTTTLAKLAIGTSNQILTSSGTAPQWTSGSSISVGTATNLAGGTTGALPYQTGAGATSFLSLGTSNYVLTAGATAPQYVAQSTLSVGSATNATNTAITANSTNATNYLTFVSATSGNLPQLVNSSITCNPSTGQITGGIAGGAF